jgi:hypothetical protein
MGGVRGGLTGGLPFRKPLIHNDLRKMTGGLEVFRKTGIFGG